MVTLYFGTFDDGIRGSRRLLELACREMGLPAELCHDGNGKPYLPGGPEISLSHTRNAAALAVSSSPVGVDLEEDRPIRPGLAARVMSPGEYRWFQEQEERADDFFTLWTLKESYYKYLGTGLPGFPNKTEFCLENGMWRLKGSELKFRVWRKNLLSLALCSGEQEVTVRKES